MLIVGLTGGIGSGKSTTARYFADLGAAIIDADEISHELTSAKQPALREITRVFGQHIVNHHGELDRNRLREIIFTHPGHRKALEAILHPLIREEMQRRLEQTDAPYCLLCIPLLVEAGLEDMVDRILVVDCPVRMQYRHLLRREGWSRQDIRAALQAQAGRRQRLAAADDVIINNAGLDWLYLQIEKLHAAYLRFAQGKHTDLP